MQSTKNLIDNDLTRGQALDVSVIDNELLKLLIPKIQSMFKYFPHDQVPVLHSINADLLNHYDNNDYSSLIANDDSIESMSSQSTVHNGIIQHDEVIEQIRLQNDHDPSSRYITKVVFHLLKGIMIYSTIFHDMATPGMLHLKTTYKPPPVSSLHTSMHQRIKQHKDRIFRYFIFSTLFPLLHELIKWKRSCYQDQILRIILADRYNSSNNQDDHPSLHPISSGASTSMSTSTSTSTRRGQHLIGVKRKLTILHHILKFTSCIVHPLQVYVYITHLLNNTGAPTLSMYLSGLQYGPLQPNGLNDQRSVNFSYAQRRLWYEEMILTCGMLVPLEMWRDLPSTIRTYFKRLVLIY